MGEGEFRVRHIIAIYQFGDGSYDVSVSYMGTGTPIEQRQGIDAEGVKGYVAELLERATAPTVGEGDDQEDDDQQEPRVHHGPAEQRGDDQQHQE